MITKTQFTSTYGGHSVPYTLYKVFDTDVDQLVETLNEINTKMPVSDGREEDGAIMFEVEGEYPALLNIITAKHHCTGYAYWGDWDGEGGWFGAYKDGKEYDNFTAEFVHNTPSRTSEDKNEEESTWDVDLVVVDPDGCSFLIENGCITEDAMKKWRCFVKEHNHK